MSLISSLPLIRNYLFLREQIALQNNQLAEIGRQLAECRSQNAKNEKLIESLTDGQHSLQARCLELGKINVEMESVLDRKIVANRYQVESDIHAEDHIFNFIKNHEKYRSNTGAALDYYFATGAESVDKLIALKREVGQQGRHTLLEFASGYGCVTRHLKKYPQEFDFTACDIHQEAVEFIENKLRCASIGSVADPAKFKLERQYGMVFALSFFSHMPRRTWGRWLEALYRNVEAGGHLIFTTHGYVSQQKMISHAEIDASGFWFNENSEQSDLDAAEYGTTITTPAFVRDEVRKLDGAQVVRFCEGFWWGHQDAWVIKKSVA